MKSKAIKSFFVFSLINFFLLLLCETSFATTNSIISKKQNFDIKTYLFVDGDLVSSPHIFVRPNKVASLVLSAKNKKNSLKMDVVARGYFRHNLEAIKINFEIHYINGKETIHSKPIFLLDPGQQGSIRISSGTHTLEMQVVAKRAHF